MIVLKKISVNNFRIYKNLNVDLGDSCTIFIGKNGAGKTTLLTAITRVLSFIFSKKSNTKQYEFIASSDQRVKSFTSTDPMFIIGDDGRGNYIYPVAISGLLQFDNKKEINWELKRMSASSGIKESYVNKAVEYWETFKGLKDLPVFAYFSDSFPHVSSSLGSKVQAMLETGFDIPRNIAYYKWDEERNCSSLWELYFTMTYKNNMFHPEKKLSNFVKSITNILVDFSKPISESSANEEMELKTVGVQVRGNVDMMVFHFVSGEITPFQNLPQGYKRIFSIVLDIACRSYILNGDCLSKGIVIIDEIELHLHPSIAQEVVKRLTKTFKNIQFIISTHSPSVISNYMQDKTKLLYRLERNHEKGYSSLDNMFGVDYTTIMHSAMETPENDTYINDLLGSYEYHINKGNKSIAAQFAEMIKKHVGENSVLYKTKVKQ